jgi:NTP pyrophosphatase (non-canonical NTP hydrolase)
MNELAREINAINRDNGWNVLTPDAWEDPHHIPVVLALIHSEVSEALEGFRVGDRTNVAEELADVVIRCLDMAGGLEIDIEREVRAKMEKNKARGFKHGGKRI